MKRTDWKYLVDTLLFICMVGIALIGFLMGLVIPKGSSAPESAKYFLGLHRHQWGNIHFYLSLTFVVLVIIHLIVSWSWIKGKSRQLFKRRWVVMLVLTALVSFLVLFLFWAFFPKQPGAYEDYGVRAGRQAKAESFKADKENRIAEKKVHEEKMPGGEKGGLHGEREKEAGQKLTGGYRAEDQSGILIHGQMTLYDIEKVTGIPARKIAEELRLPAGAPLDEYLGRLRKRYSFTMQDVRDVVSSLMKKNDP